MAAAKEETADPAKTEAQKSTKDNVAVVKAATTADASTEAKPAVVSHRSVAAKKSNTTAAPDFGSMQTAFKSMLSNAFKSKEKHSTWSPPHPLTRHRCLNSPNI